MSAEELAQIEKRLCPNDEQHEAHAWNAWPIENRWFRCDPLAPVCRCPNACTADTNPPF